MKARNLVDKFDWGMLYSILRIRNTIVTVTRNWIQCAPSHSKAYPPIHGTYNTCRPHSTKTAALFTSFPSTDTASRHRVARSLQFPRWYSGTPCCAIDPARIKKRKLYDCHAPPLPEPSQTPSFPKSPHFAETRKFSHTSLPRLPPWPSFRDSTRAAAVLERPWMLTICKDKRTLHILHCVCAPTSSSLQVLDASRRSRIHGGVLLCDEDQFLAFWWPRLQRTKLFRAQPQDTALTV